MTREEAIGILKDERWYMSRYSEEYKEVYDMAIEALKALPSAEQVTGKLNNRDDSLLTDDKDKSKEKQSKLDLISRQDAVNEIHKYFVEEINKTPYTKDEDGDEVYTDISTVNSLLACNKELSKRIKSLPSASVGTEMSLPKWIPVSERLPEDLQKAITCNKHGEMMIGTYTEWGWMFHCYFEKPIAWMPLPDPYREKVE